MFDYESSFGDTNPLGGAGAGWSGYPGATTTADGTVSSAPGTGMSSGGATFTSTVSDSLQSTATAATGLLAWPAAHQTLFIGAVVLFLGGWFLHHKGMLE